MATKQYKVLASVHSHKSGGYAKILAFGNQEAYDELFFSVSTHRDKLFSRLFRLEPIGQIVEVTVEKISSRRRKIVDVRPTTRDDFIAQNAHVIFIVSDDEDNKPKSEAETKSRNTHTNNIYIRKSDQAVLAAIHTIAAQERMARVLLVGGSGLGKSSIARQMASEHDMEFVRVNCANIQIPEEAFFVRAANANGTVDEKGQMLVVETPLTKAIQDGNCVILLDEMNRLEPFVANTFLELLEAPEKVHIGGDMWVTLGDNIVIYGTMNNGYEFSGTFQIDAALRNRFDVTISVTYLPKRTEISLLMQRTNISEEVAQEIVRKISFIRSTANDMAVDCDASTRTSLAIARLVRAGLDVNMAFHYAVFSSLPRESQKALTDAIT